MGQYEAQYDFLKNQWTIWDYRRWTTQWIQLTDCKVHEIKKWNMTLRKRSRWKKIFSVFVSTETEHGSDTTQKQARAPHFNLIAQRDLEIQHFEP